MLVSSQWDETWSPAFCFLCSLHQHRRYFHGTSPTTSLQWSVTALQRVLSTCRLLGGGVSVVRRAWGMLVSWRRHDTCSPAFGWFLLQHQHRFCSGFFFLELFCQPALDAVPALLAFDGCCHQQVS